MFNIPTWYIVGPKKKTHFAVVVYFRYNSISCHSIFWKTILFHVVSKANNPFALALFSCTIACANARCLFVRLFGFFFQLWNVVFIITRNIYSIILMKTELQLEMYREIERTRERWKLSWKVLFAKTKEIEIDKEKDRII